MSKEDTRQRGPGKSESLDQILRRAAELLTKGLLPEAKGQASRAITARPANALAQNLMAMILFHQGRIGRALELFESLVERNPEVLALRINAGGSASEFPGPSYQDDNEEFYPLDWLEGFVHPYLMMQW